MEKVLLVIGAVAVAGAVSAILTRREASSSRPAEHHIPDRLDRSDFAAADTEWLIAVFSSATCETCAAVLRHIRRLTGPLVESQEVEFDRDGELHERYGINAVPTTVIVDSAGRVRKSFLGPVGYDEIKRALGEAMAITESRDI